MPEQFQPPAASRAEVRPQQTPSPAPAEVHPRSRLDGYTNRKIAEAQSEVDSLREQGRFHAPARIITPAEQEAVGDILKKVLAGQELTEEDYKHYWAAVHPGADLDALWKAHQKRDDAQWKATLDAIPNKPLEAAQARLKRLEAARSGDYSGVAAELQQDITLQQYHLNRANQEQAQPRGTLEGDEVYFPLVEEIQEKEKLQAQAPTPQRKIIIDLLQEQLKKTKRGEAAAQAKQAQERIDWLTSVKQSIPPPTPTK